MSYPELAERLRKAFGKRKWFRTICPECGERVEYAPKENWDGKLNCKSCKNDFTLLILDHFTIEFRDEVNENE